GLGRGGPGLLAPASGRGDELREDRGGVLVERAGRVPDPGEGDPGGVERQRAVPEAVQLVPALFPEREREPRVVVRGGAVDEDEERSDDRERRLLDATA